MCRLADTRATLVVLAVLIVCLAPSARARVITATVEAPWNETPLLQEGCEWAARTFGDNLFFRCLDDVWSSAHASQPSSSCRDMTQRDQYAVMDTILSQWVAEGLITANRKALFDMETAARSFSPAVEAHYVLATDASLLSRNARHAQDDSCDGEAFATVRGASHEGTALLVRDVNAFASAVEKIRSRSTQHQDGGQQHTDEPLPLLQAPVDKLDHFLPASQPHLASTASDVVYVFLYGLVGDAKTKQWLRFLETQSQQSPVVVSFRHLPASRFRLCHPEQVRHLVLHPQEAAWGRPLRVQGYGATLDLKNMEYKVVDEKATPDTASHGDSTDSAAQDKAAAVALDSTLKGVLQEQVVGGVDLARLRTRYPELVVQLDTFANDLEQLLGAEETKVTFDLMELQNLGLATVAFVADRNASDRLTVLADIASRFPFYASQLSKMASKPARFATVKEELEVLQATLRSGVTAAVLDGEMLSTEELSLFTVLDLLREKEARLEGLRSLLLLRRGEITRDEWQTGALASVSDDRWTPTFTTLTTVRFHDEKLLTAVDEANKYAARLAIPSDTIIWLNSVEKDRRFAHLAHHLSSRGPHGEFVPLRRNLLSAVVVLDPRKADGMMIVFQLLRMLKDGFPIRIGLIVVDFQSSGFFKSDFNLDTQQASGTSAASAPIMSVAATIFELCKRSNEPLGIVAQYLSVVARELFEGSSSDATTETSSVITDLSREFLQQASGAKLEAVLHATEFQRYFYFSQEYVRNMGLLRSEQSNVVLVNGRVTSNVYETLNAELENVIQLIDSGVLHEPAEGEDLLDAIWIATKASKHFQPALFESPVQLSLHHPEEVAFLQDYPFILPASHDGDVALVSQIVVLPCHNATLTDWQIALQAVEALTRCERGAGPAPACHRTRLTVIRSCATHHQHGGNEASEVESGVVDLIAQLEYLFVSVQRLREEERAQVVHDYMHAVLKSTQGLPRSMALADGNVVGRVAAITWSARVGEALAGASQTQQKSPYEILRRQFILTVPLADVGADSTGTGIHERPVLLANGRVIALDDSFVTEDFNAVSQQQLPLAQFAWHTLDQLALHELAPSETHGFSADELDSELYSGKTAALASFLASMGSDEGDVLQKRLRVDVKTSSVAFQHKRQDSLPVHHQMIAVVDPTARDSQVLIAICQYLAQSPLGVDVTVYLNPPVAVQYPVRDIFTYVATPFLQFDSVTGGVVAPRALFRGLPMEQLLTLGIVEPQSWLVMPHRARDDLDNIILAKLPKDRPVLSATYRIHSLLVSGTALFAGQRKREAAAGLPLSLRPASAVVSKPPTNTLVMEQSGYYQLQATAGVWQMAVQPGPMADAFTIRSVRPRHRGESPAHTAPAFPNPAGSPFVTVDSFRGEFAVASVTATVPTTDSGVSVVDGPGQIAQIAASMANKFETGWPPKNGDGDALMAPVMPTLNIFSVASGHLYERFLRMMMYSVFQSSSDIHGANTTRVKFWVIENYLSPRFKAYIPTLAAHYGFEVGFVTYQWPFWLPKQTEKQRKIWAYKILFLDVIFPLEVDRIIFVDADQTARADLHELYRMDIHGAPVAMTPFCVENMNTATEGFRFWAEGFWKKHLNGKPYHISAIFLVDLQRFRAMRAGDAYRRTYSALAGDPNSLSNLDQDLPNYLQDRVPIYSLPEEWLWCETWCNTESKARAKTIDLCNNPLTKMPKLDNAKMIVPNWEETDNMLESLAQQLMPVGQEHGDSAATD